jgi:hypothetical protein
MRILFPMLCLIACSGCMPFNNWHTESYFDQNAYQFSDSKLLRQDLDSTVAFLPTIGLKPVPEAQNSAPATEAIFIRDIDDHFHLTVNVRGLAHVNDSGWTMIVRVDSYDIGQEGAIAAGKSLLKEIGDWHEHVLHNKNAWLQRVPQTRPASRSQPSADAQPATQ